MQDEQFMRQWNELHEDFTADLHQALSRRRPELGTNLAPIGPAYDVPVEAKVPPALTSAAKASLRGLAASVLTFALWITVIALATPTPGLAATLAQGPATACTVTLA